VAFDVFKVIDVDYEITVTVPSKDCLSVRLSAWNNTRTSGRIFLNFVGGAIFIKFVVHSNFG
jgi:hypothetical protein